MKAHACATGPTTARGLAAVTDNLAGHPTPEEARVTRFNALKTGAFAKVATYFPAAPGRYPQCTQCEYLDNGCKTEFKACLKRAELHMKHQIAFLEKDPGVLRDTMATLQSNVTAIIEDMIAVIIGDGVRTKSPVWYGDKEGGIHFVQAPGENGEPQQIYELGAHPLLKPLLDALSKNNLSLSDLMMTPKTTAGQEMGEGLLEAVNGTTAADFMRRQERQLADLPEQMDAARRATEADPILIEHQENTGVED